MQLLFLLLASYLIVSTYGQCSANRDCTSLGYPNNCCSQYGWCGTTSDYCGSGCQSGPCYSGSSSSSGGSSSGSSSGSLSGKTIVTWYCSLSNPNGLGYCYNTGDPQHEADCAIDVTSIGSSLGVAANNPILFSKGASSVCQWNGANCGTCYTLSGPGGSKTIMVTDCCAGYPGSCECSQGCTASNCDWCAANDHNHFDLDYDSFSQVCGSEASQGNCVVSSAVEVPCPSRAVSENSAVSEQTGQLSAGVLAGIVVGSVVGIILIVLVIVFSYRKSTMEVV